MKNQNKLRVFENLYIKFNCSKLSLSIANKIFRYEKVSIICEYKLGYVFQPALYLNI